METINRDMKALIFSFSTKNRRTATAETTIKIMYGVDISGCLEFCNPDYFT
jgi:hypothetical protein